MNTDGIGFIIIALIGVIINYSSGPISKRFGFSELAIKLTALFIVLVSILLLFLPYGK